MIYSIFYVIMSIITLLFLNLLLVKSKMISSYDEVNMEELLGYAVCMAVWPITLCFVIIWAIKIFAIYLMEDVQ